MKRFFYFEKLQGEQDRDAQSDSNEETPDEEIKRKLKDLITQREIISMKYISYLMVSFLNACCCCCVNKCKQGSCKVAFKKAAILEVARKKLAKE